MTSWEDLPTVLPRDTKPSHYDITLNVDLAAKSFSGLVVIDLETTQPRDTLVLHSVGLTLTKAVFNGKDCDTAALTFDEKLETVTIKLPESAAPGQHKLTVDFHGPLRKDMRSETLPPFLRRKLDHS